MFLFRRMMTTGLFLALVILLSVPAAAEKAQEVVEITRTGFAKGRVNNAWPPTQEDAEKEG